MKSLKLYDSSTKLPPYYSRLFPVIGDHSLYFQSFGHKILTFSLTAYEGKHKNATGRINYKSCFSFIPLRRNTFFSIKEVNNLEYPYQCFNQILIQNHLDHPLTLVKGLIGYAKQDTSLKDFQTTIYRVNELTDFMDAHTSIYLTHGTSETLKKLYCLNPTKQQERGYKTQQKIFHITFDISMSTETDKNFLKNFIF